MKWHRHVATLPFLLKTFLVPISEVFNYTDCNGRKFLEPCPYEVDHW